MSKEVSCPHCKQTFEMDAAGYADIVNQIKDAEFETEIHQRLQSEQEKHVLAVKVAEAKIKEDSAKNITDKDKQIGRLKNELKSGSYELCHGCRMPISLLDTKSDKYEKGVSCKNCFDKTSMEKKKRLRERNKQIQIAKRKGIYNPYIKYTTTNFF